MQYPYSKQTEEHVFSDNIKSRADAICKKCITQIFCVKQGAKARFLSIEKTLTPNTAIMNELKETIKSYVLQHPELSEVQIKEEISRQLKGEIFPGEVDEIYAALV